MVKVCQNFNLATWGFKMKKIMDKKWLRFSVFAIIMAVVLVCLDVFVFVDFHYGNAYEKFYAEEENSLDLISIGNSTVRNGIIPAEIWNEYGITSYNIVSAPTHPEVICIAINELARLQNPKVVYIDLQGLTEQKISDTEYFVTEYVKNMPDCEAKSNLIQQYDFLQRNLKDNASYELFKNHNNYRNPEYMEMLFLGSGKEALKGFVPFYEITTQHKYELDMTTILELPNDGKYYLQKIMETCNQYPEITFVFGKMPRCLNDKIVNQTYMLRSAISTIEANGYTYVEWEDMLDEIGFEYDKDFRDSHHLNVYGAQKFTKFYADYLIDNYGLFASSKSESITQNFDVCYKNYLKCI